MRLGNKIHLLTICCVLPLIAICAAALADSFAGAPVKSSVLPNGLKVIVLEDHSIDLVAIDIWVKAGNVCETESNRGAAHFIEHLLFRGSARRAPGQADREIENLGASLDAATTKDTVRISSIVASKYFDIALDAMVDTTMRAKLDPEEIRRERAVILDEIARRDSDPLQALAVAVERAFYLKHPYSFPIQGEAANVTSMTPETIREFYRSYFAPNNMAVVIVGDISSAKAVEAVTAAFREFEKKEMPAPQVPALAPLTAVKKEKIARDTRVEFCAVSFPAPGVQEMADVYPMDLLLQYLVASYNSWMQTELKDSKSLVQVSGGEFTTRRYAGTLMLMFSASPGDIETVRQNLFAKLKRMKESPLTEAEVSGAKRSLEGGFAFESEVFSGRSRYLGFYESLGDYKLALSYIENIRKVTPDEIIQVARKYINTDACVIIEVGP